MSNIQLGLNTATQERRNTLPCLSRASNASTTPLPRYTADLFLGCEVGLKVRGAVVLGAAAVARVFGPLAARAGGGGELVLGDGFVAGCVVCVSVRLQGSSGGGRGRETYCTGAQAAFRKSM
jgi:hypothetical protein